MTVNRSRDNKHGETPTEEASRRGVSILQVRRDRVVAMVKEHNAVSEEKKPRGKDTTSGKRLESLRGRMVRMPEVHLTPDAYAEVEAMLTAGESSSKADLMRQALHEKYLRWVAKNA